MSLQVWLPLNGDLHNQGLSNIQFTNNGATINNNGKIGKCYNVNNSMGIVVNNSITLGTTFSITCWIKINSYNQDWANAFKIYKDGYDYIGLCMNQANATTKQLGFHIYKNNGSNARTGVTDNYYIPLIVGKWYHLCFIVTSTQVITYQDGIKIKTNNITTNFPSITNYNLSLGKSSLFYGLDCSINDFRLYDHALSAKEVEEISKGLILHYKLNNNGLGNPNLLPCGGAYIQNSPWTTTFNKVDGYAWVTNSAFKATPGKTYTISVKCDGTLANTHGQSANPSTKSWTFWLYICNSDTTKSWQTGAYDSPINLTSVNHNYRKIGDTHVWTYTLSSTQEYISLRTNSYSNGTDNVTVKWWNMKVEEGDNFTGWSPNFSNASIIYDSSGYNNNGTIVGSLETTTPSPKYSCATSFDNKEYIIHKLPENMYQATYSFWVKASSYTSYGAIYMPYQSPSAGTSPWFAINTESCKVWAYFGNNSPNYTKGSGTMPLNEWHHCVYVWNNGVAQWYVDGEKSGNSVTYTGRTFIQNTANATIGNSFTGTNWNGTPFTGEISDFRIYATALTEAQIKELYKTSMIVNGSSATARNLE